MGGGRTGRPGQRRKTLSAELKAKVALEALKGQKTPAQMASEYEVHPNPVSAWKQEAQEALQGAFTSQRGKKPKTTGPGETALYEPIGRLPMELDWLKKKSAPYL
jgi:transposase